MRGSCEIVANIVWFRKLSKVVKSKFLFRNSGGKGLEAYKSSKRINTESSERVLRVVGSKGKNLFQDSQDYFQKELAL